MIRLKFIITVFNCFHITDYLHSKYKENKVDLDKTRFFSLVYPSYSISFALNFLIKIRSFLLILLIN